MNETGGNITCSLKLGAAVLLLMLGMMNAVAETISKEEAKAIVHGFLDSWETGNIQEFDSIAHKDIEFAYPGGRLNKKQLISMFNDYQKKKTDIKIYHWDVFLLQGDLFATAYQFAATDRKTGKRQAVGTGIVGKLRNGKILEYKEYYDEEVAAMQYEGKLPLDEGEVSPWPASIWLRPDTID